MTPGGVIVEIKLFSYAEFELLYVLVIAPDRLFCWRLRWPWRLLELDLGFEFCIDCDGFSDESDVMLRMFGAFESC